MSEQKSDTSHWVLSRPIAPGERVFGRFDMFAIWFACGVIITAPAAGGLAIGAPILFYTLPLMTIAAAIAFFPHFIMGRVAQKFGLTNFILSRRSFGILGTNFGAMFNVTQCVGYLAIQTVMAATTAMLVASKFDIPLSYTSILVIMFTISIAIVAFGPLGIRIAQRIGAISLMIFGGTMTYVLATGGFDWNAVLFTPNPEPTMTYPHVFELFVAYNLTWLPLIGDYSRYAKARMGGSWMPIIGLCAAQCWFFVLGALSMGVLGNWDPSGFVAEYGLGRGAISMLFMVVGCITTNAVLLYCAITSVLPTRPQKVELGRGRWILLGVFSAITFGLCYTPILDLFGTFLVAVSGVLISSFFGVVIADWIHHKYHVDNIDDLYNMDGPFRFIRGFNWRALVPMAISMGVQWYIYFTPLYDRIPPVGVLLPGMALSGAVYLLFNKIWPPKYAIK